MADTESEGEKEVTTQDPQVDASKGEGEAGVPGDQPGESDAKGEGSRGKSSNGDSSDRAQEPSVSVLVKNIKDSVRYVR